MGDATNSRTLWSQTALETLLLTLRDDRSDAVINEILDDMLGRSFKPDYLVDKVRQELGLVQAHRLLRLLAQRRAKGAS